MREFLVTDCTNNSQSWVSGATLRDALISHESARRVRDGRPALFGNERISSDDGPIVRASLGDSAVIGLRSYVIRESV